MMKIMGFVSAILPELSFEEVVAFAAQEGFACVELMCWPRGKAERRYAGVTHVDADSLGAADVARMKKLLSEKKVSVLRPGLLSQPSGPRMKRTPRSTGSTSRRWFPPRRPWASGW